MAQIDSPSSHRAACSQQVASHREVRRERARDFHGRARKNRQRQENRNVSRALTLLTQQKITLHHDRQGRLVATSAVILRHSSSSVFLSESIKNFYRRKKQRSRLTRRCGVCTFCCFVFFCAKQR